MYVDCSRSVANFNSISRIFCYIYLYIYTLEGFHDPIVTAVQMAYIVIRGATKVEPVQVKLWDMKVRAAARILEKGVQNDLIQRTEGARDSAGGRCWKDHCITWAPVKRPHYNTSLEEILASMGENGESELEWEFPRGRKRIHTVQSGELGTKDTPRILWEMRIRDLKEERWTAVFTDGHPLRRRAGGIALALENHSNAGTW